MHRDETSSHFGSALRGVLAMVLLLERSGPSRSDAASPGPGSGGMRRAVRDLARKLKPGSEYVYKKNCLSGVERDEIPNLESEIVPPRPLAGDRARRPRKSY